jgi:ribonucleotide reductase beta subunit family protein with ferritin-like domain
MAIQFKHGEFSIFSPDLVSILHVKPLKDMQMEEDKKVMDSLKKAVQEEKEWAEQQELFNMLVQGIDLEKLLIETFKELEG